MEDASRHSCRVGAPLRNPFAAVLFTAGIVALTAAVDFGPTSAAESFTPVRVETEKLTITGMPSTFQPRPFTPVRIETEKLTITGAKP